MRIFTIFLTIYIHTPSSGQIMYTRPKPREVARIVTCIAQRAGCIGSILILGDITCAHCFDRKYEVSRRGVQKHINNMMGGCADVYFACVPGEGTKDITAHARDMARYGERELLRLRNSCMRLELAMGY